MTKQELTNEIIDSFRKFCISKNECCNDCPYEIFDYCELQYTISYLNKRHLLKGLTNEKENNKNK